MKEVIVEIPRVDKVTRFEAIDGAQFDSREDCRKYEESALGMMRGKIKEYAVNYPQDAWVLMGGSDDHGVIGYRLPTEQAADTFLHWLFLECPWYLDEYHVERKAEVEKAIRKAQKENDLILIGQNCDDDYYYINTRQNIIDNLMNLDKKQDDSKRK